MLAARTSPRDPEPLLNRLKRRIASEGPLTVAQYMEVCLGDPDAGYYTTRDPFGARGDFTTAPEISQIFGELIGLWCAVVWQEMGAPRAVKLIELGPGRGTLMADALRAAAQVPEFVETAQLHLVETSVALSAMQAERLGTASRQVAWHRRLDEIPEGAAILIANEFLDALPVRQFERRDGAWFERCVGLSPQGLLEFCAAPAPLETPGILPRHVREQARDGDTAEIRPGADAIIATVSARAETAPVAALFIDYGYETSAPGETLQAVKAHDFTDPLAEPGKADLTAHVDFDRLGDLARRGGLAVHGPLGQGEFLTALGLKERCERLLEKAGACDRDLIASGARRLVEPEQMGALFKVLALTSPGLAPPPFAGTRASEQEK